MRASSPQAETDNMELALTRCGLSAGAIRLPDQAIPHVPLCLADRYVGETQSITRNSRKHSFLSQKRTKTLDNCPCFRYK